MKELDLQNSELFDQTFWVKVEEQINKDLLKVGISYIFEWNKNKTLVEDFGEFFDAVLERSSSLQNFIYVVDLPEIDSFEKIIDLPTQIVKREAQKVFIRQQYSS